MHLLFQLLCVSAGSLMTNGFHLHNNKPITGLLPKLSIPSAALPFLGIVGILLSPSYAFGVQEVKTYTNDRYHTILSYPADFEMKTGQISGDREVIAFTDPNDPDTSASLVFSPVPAGCASQYFPLQIETIQPSMSSMH